MRLIRWGLLVVLLSILAVAVYQTLLWLGVFGGDGESHVLPLSDGDQEIALIEPATNIDDWGRLVTALQLLEIDWPKINPTLPKLRVNLKRAFPQRTAEVSEISLSFHTEPRQHLRLRWYKISGEHDAASWVRKLFQRNRPPLAVLGGATSDRAVRVAQALRATYPSREMQAPVFLMTTATADNTGEEKRLIEEYPGRTFRFSFTNQKMVKSLLRFVQQTRELWPGRSTDARGLTNTIATLTSVGDPLLASSILSGNPAFEPLAMHTVFWEDDSYSIDLANLFVQEFGRRYPYSEIPTNDGRIRYSVGGFFHPSQQEQTVVGTMLSRPIAPQSILVLPTQAVRMRRFLINLRQRSPMAARNLVILNGDAISFHNVYRDRDVMWNILDLPYSLVFFSHRNPIDHAAGFRWVSEGAFDPKAVPQLTTSGTHDILLYRDICEAFLYAACDQGKVLDDTLEIRRRLDGTRWYYPPPDKAKSDPARVCNVHVHPFAGAHERFFDALGNRKVYTGEHVVWIKPNFTGDAVDLTGRISVWSSEARKNGGAWQLVEAHDATYNQARVEDAEP